MDKHGLTFGDLNQLIDKWTMDTLDMQDTFRNQAEDIKDFFLEVGNHREKLQRIHAWLNLIYYHDKRLDANLETITANLLFLEGITKNLEDRLPDLEDIRKEDPVRVQLFDTIDSVFGFIEKLKEMNDVNCGAVCRIQEVTSKNPAEQLAKIMMCHLQSLEDIEVKLYKIMTYITHVETIKNMICKKPKSILRNACQ